MIYPARFIVAAVLAMCSAATVSAAAWLGQPPEATDAPVDVAVVAANPERWLDQPVTVSGRITDVCTNRGCWAVFESGGETLRIVARDHGFVIPADVRGPAIAYGVVERKALSDDAARHLVDEDGADPALLDDPVEYRLIAGGVKLDREASD